MLSPLLQEYLVENGYLPLPDAGQLTIEHAPAQLKAIDKTFTAPASKIVFSNSTPTAADIEKLTTFIGRQLNIADDQAITLLKQETGSALSVNKNGDILQWPEWNLWDENEDVLPDSQYHSLNSYLPSFLAEKIHRQPVTIKETTTLPSETFLEETYPELDEPAPKDYWWVWALVVFIISVLLIANRYA